MSNHPWVCFSCRRAVRRASPETMSVLSATCGDPCTHLSPTVKIPPKDKPKDWAALRERVHRYRTTREERQRIHLAERKRWLKRRIEELENAKSSAYRDYLLRRYRNELDEALK